jgi:hypothetical protein
MKRESILRELLEIYKPRVQEVKLVCGENFPLFDWPRREFLVY